MAVTGAAAFGALTSVASVAAPLLSGIAAIKSLTQGAKQSIDPAAAQAAVDAKATQSANARLAMRRKALASNSLVTGGSSDVMSTGVLNGGKPTLGGG